MMRHEIEAARKRLSAAKEQVSSTAKNADSARAMLEQARAMMEASTQNLQHAQSMNDAAKNEACDAEKRLKEKKLESTDEAKKKRKHFSHFFIGSRAQIR